MIVLDDWQRAVDEYDGSFLLCTGRRVGKTYIMSKKAVDRMARSLPRSCPVIMMSLTEDQAEIIVSMALSYAREVYPRLVGKGKDRPTLKTLTVNGNKMIVRPVGNSGDGARGFEGGILIVDEASRMPSLFWIAAKPLILTTNGQIWLGSTPFGKGTREKPNYFWKRFEESFINHDPLARFKVFYKSTVDAMNERPISVSWTQAQRDGALRILERERSEMSVLEFGQEYLGLFQENLIRFFSEEWVSRVCMLKRRPVLVPGVYFGGVDVARLGSNKSAFAVGERVSSQLCEQVECVTTEKTLTTDTERKILEFQRIYKCRMWGIDGMGVGGGVIDQCLLVPELKHCVVDLANSRKDIDSNGAYSKKLLKEDMYVNLLRMGEHSELLLLDDDRIINSLASALYEYDEHGNLRVFGQDNDIREAIVRMAWLAAKDKRLSLWCC